MLAGGLVDGGYRLPYLLLWRGSVEELPYAVHGVCCVVEMLQSQGHLRGFCQICTWRERIVQVSGRVGECM